MREDFADKMYSAELAYAVQQQQAFDPTTTFSITYPFKDAVFNGDITDAHIEMLNNWAELCSSEDFKNDVRTIIYESVGKTIFDSEWYHRLDYLAAAINHPYNFCTEQSIKNFIYAYITSFAQNPVNPFQPAIDLWNMGLVPAYDGQKWRLYMGNINSEGDLWPLFGATGVKIACELQ